MRRQEQSRLSSKHDRIELGETSSSWYVESPTQGIVRKTRSSSMPTFFQPFLVEFCSGAFGISEPHQSRADPRVQSRHVGLEFLGAGKFLQRLAKGADAHVGFAKESVRLS